MCPIASISSISLPAIFLTVYFHKQVSVMESWKLVFSHSLYLPFFLGTWYYAHNFYGIFAILSFKMVNCTAWKGCLCQYVMEVCAHPSLNLVVEDSYRNLAPFPLVNKCKEFRKIKLPHSISGKIVTELVGTIEESFRAEPAQLVSSNPYFIPAFV